MKICKRLVMVFLTVSLLVSGVMYISAQEANNELYTSYAQDLQIMRLLVGNTDGDLMLAHPLTRDEGIAMLLSIYGLSDDARKLTDTEANDILKGYKDLSKSDWSRKFVAYAVNEGYAGGYSDTKFAPKDALQARQFIKMFMNAAGKPCDYETAYTDYINEDGEDAKNILKSIADAANEVKIKENANTRQMLRQDAVDVLAPFLVIVNEDTGKAQIDILLENGFVKTEDAMKCAYIKMYLETEKPIAEPIATTESTTVPTEAPTAPPTGEATEEPPAETATPSPEPTATPSPAPTAEPTP